MNEKNGEQNKPYESGHRPHPHSNWKKKSIWNFQCRDAFKKALEKKRRSRGSWNTQLNVWNNTIWNQYLSSCSFRRFRKNSCAFKMNFCHLFMFSGNSFPTIQIFKWNRKKSRDTKKTDEKKEILGGAAMIMVDSMNWLLFHSLENGHKSKNSWNYLLMFLFVFLAFHF